MNYILIGEMGSGKDTVASFMPGYIRLSFAEPLKEVCHLLRLWDLKRAEEIMSELFDGLPPPELKGKLKEFAEYPRPVEGTKDRVLYQGVGAWAREYDGQVWVRGLQRRIKPHGKYVITDCRYQNELSPFQGKENWRSIYVVTHPKLQEHRLVTRDNQYNPEWKKHESEIEVPYLGEQADLIIHNDGTPEQLAYAVSRLMSDHEHDGKYEYGIELPR